MKKRLLFFFVGLVCSLVAMADEPVTVGLTAAKDASAKTFAKYVFNGYNDIITISSDILRGSEINTVAVKDLYVANTKYTGGTTWRKSVNSNNDSKFVESANQWVGYELNVPAGYKFSITSARAHIMVSDDMNLFWKMKIFDADNNVLYTSLDKKSTRANDTDFNVDFTGEGLETTLAALANLSGKITVRIYVSQKGSTKYFGSDAFTVTGNLVEDTQTKYTKPSISLGAYDKTAGTYAVTLSTQNDEEGVINYTVGSGDKVTGAASGTTINVVPNTTITATVSGSSFDESDEATLTTAAAPKLAKPTYTVDGFDFTTFKYTISLAAAEGAINYAVDGGSYATYTEAIQVDPSTQVTAYAELTNMTNSDVITINLPAAPVDGVCTTPTTAGTYTDGMTYNAGAFTIPSTNSYIGSQISSGNSSINGAIKMRISRNADPAGSQDSKYGFHILVNSGYTLSEVSLKMLNNYDTKIALVGVYVDNSTDNSLEAPIALPFASAKTIAAAEAKISGIAAKQKVVFVFEKTEGTDNPNQAQIIISAKGLVPVYNTNVTPNGFGTIYYAKELVCPEGTKAYTGTLNDNTLSLSELTDGIIPANTPAIIEGEGGLFTVGTSNATAVTSDLQGTLEDIATSSITEGTVFVLGYVEGQTGFYEYTGATLGANKAYLVLPTNAPAKINIVKEGDNVTGINAVNAQTVKNSVMYNLAGQRVNANAKGLVIMNGKVMIKK